MIRKSSFTEMELLPIMDHVRAWLRRDGWNGSSRKKSIVSMTISWSWKSNRANALSKDEENQTSILAHQWSKMPSDIFTRTKWSWYIDSSLCISYHLIERSIISDGPWIIHFYWFPRMFDLSKCHRDEGREIDTRMMCVVSSPLLQIWIETDSGRNLLFPLYCGSCSHIVYYDIRLL